MRASEREADPSGALTRICGSVNPSARAKANRVPSGETAGERAV